jgi:hypothetical protein
VANELSIEINYTEIAVAQNGYSARMATLEEQRMMITVFFAEAKVDESKDVHLWIIRVIKYV